MNGRREHVSVEDPAAAGADLVPCGPIDEQGVRSATGQVGPGSSVRPAAGPEQSLASPTHRRHTEHSWDFENVSFEPRASNVFIVL